MSGEISRTRVCVAEEMLLPHGLEESTASESLRAAVSDLQLGVYDTLTLKPRLNSTRT